MPPERIYTVKIVENSVPTSVVEPVIKSNDQEYPSSNNPMGGKNRKSREKLRKSKKSKKSLKKRTRKTRKIIKAPKSRCV
jgi:hypothetical protein